MIGIPVRLRDSLTMDDLGLVHALQPLEPGDVVAPLEFGPPLQIVAFLQAPYHASFEVATALVALPCWLSSFRADARRGG